MRQAFARLATQPVAAHGDALDDQIVHSRENGHAIAEMLADRGDAPDVAARLLRGVERPGSADPRTRRGCLIFRAPLLLRFVAHRHASQRTQTRQQPTHEGMMRRRF